MNTLAPSFFDLINLILSGKEDMHESFSASIFDRIFFIFAGQEDNHTVLDEFEI